VKTLCLSNTLAGVTAAGIEINASCKRSMGLFILGLVQHPAKVVGPVEVAQVGLVLFWLFLYYPLLLLILLAVVLFVEVSSVAAVAAVVVAEDLIQMVILMALHLVQWPGVLLVFVVFLQGTFVDSSPHRLPQIGFGLLCFILFESKSDNAV
jgi:hypothetical protein